MPKVSVVLSIHNRIELTRRALHSYLWQTMPAKDFEIILVDDESTENTHAIYEPFIGRLNIKWLQFDWRKHPAFRRLNPAWSPGMAVRKYHTPALTLNVGFSAALSPVLCICHPEIIHGPRNLELAYEYLAVQRKPWFIFGLTYLGDERFNAWLNSNWFEPGWDAFMASVKSHGIQSFSDNELYWYTSFLSRTAAHAVRGVDSVFCGGCAAEDDDFKHRVDNAGWGPALRKEIIGLHQSHETHEKEPHRLRNTKHWEDGLKHNRAILFERKNHGFPEKVNLDHDWTNSFCVTRTVEHLLPGYEAVL